MKKPFHDTLHEVLSNQTEEVRFEADGEMEDFLELLHALQKNTSVKKAVFSGMFLNGDPSVAIADMLTANQHLTTLSCSRLGPQIAEALLINRTLTCLELYNSSFDLECARALAEVLKVNKVLNDLTIISHEFGDEGALFFADALRGNQSLQHFFMHQNNVGTQGCAAVFEALKSNKTLISLGIGYNHIGIEGSRVAGEMLRVNTSLKCLYMSSGAVSFALLGPSLQVNRSIQDISFNETSFDIEDCRALAEVLKVNNSLKSLGLSQSYFDSAGVCEIFESLKWNYALTSLDLRMINFTHLESKLLVECMKCNAGLVMLSLDWDCLEGDCLGSEKTVNSYLQRNQKMLARAKQSTESLIACKRWRRPLLNVAPKEMMLMIGQHLWLTKKDLDAWAKGGQNDAKETETKKRRI